MCQRVKLLNNQKIIKISKLFKIQIFRCEICGNLERNLSLKKTVDQVEEFDPIANSIEGKFNSIFLY